MNHKLTDIRGLENITIAAYDIPDNLILASTVKQTKVAGKNNVFLSGKPSAAIDRDLDVLSVSAHRISCTYSFRMSEKGYRKLIETLGQQREFTESDKRAKDGHRVFYVNKRKFTLSYFKKKGIAAVYANSDLFDNKLAEFFVKDWDNESEKNAVRHERNNSTQPRKQTIPAALTSLPLPDNSDTFQPEWPVSDIGFRVNRIVVTGSHLSQRAVRKIKTITDKSNNSVNLKSETRGSGKRMQQVTLISNNNSYFAEAVACMKKESHEPISYEIRFPMRTNLWKYISSRNWLDRAKSEETDKGFKMLRDNTSVSFSRNENTGICEIEGKDSELLYQCIMRLEDLFKNTADDRRVDKEAINETIRKKIPYTIKVLKDQADQFINLISPSFVLLNDTEIELTDYSPMVFSVYRGVELYLKYIADQSGIDLNGQSVGKLFNKTSHYQKKLEELISDSLKGDILESIFKNFSDYRNTLFHANLDNVMVISSREAAEDICVAVLKNLEAASFQIHLDEMTIII